MNNHFICISKKNLFHLFEKALAYDALESGGVDNWEWYSDSFKDFMEYNNANDDLDWEEFVEQSFNNLFQKDSDLK